MKKICLLLMTVLCSLYGMAQSAYYNIPEGAFFRGLDDKAAVNATAYIHMAYDGSKDFKSTVGAGDWYSNSKLQKSNVETYTAGFTKMGTSYYIPELKVGETSYVYGNDPANGTVYFGSGNMYNMTPARLFDTSGASARKIIGTWLSTAHDSVAQFFFNKNLMYLNYVSIPVTGNKTGYTVDDLFPNGDDSYLLVNVYKANVTYNADGSIKSKSYNEKSDLIASKKVTKSDFTASNPAYIGTIKAEFDEPLIIDGEFVVKIEHLKSCYFYIYSALGDPNTTCVYWAKGSLAGFTTATTTYTMALSVHAMFPAIAKADASVETLTFTDAGGDVNAVVNSNVDPKDVDITMPDWIAKKEITYETGTFSASKSSTIVFTAAENTTGEMRIGTITINNRGKEISYNVEQGSASSDVAVESITLDKTKIELQSGYDDVITATVSPENATDKSLIWTSSDPTVVTVDPDGTIHYKKDGTVTITAKSNSNPDVTATCEVTAYHWEDFAPFGASTGTWQMNSVYTTSSIFTNQNVSVSSMCLGEGNETKKIKIKNFGAGELSTEGVELNMNWNVTTNDITFTKQPIGKKNSKDFDLYIADNSYFAGGENSSKYDQTTGLFTITPVYFYVNAENKNVAYTRKTEYFQLNAAITVSDAGYATTYLPFAVSIPEEVSVFTATINEGTKQVTMNELGAAALPAETAVVIKAEPDTYVFNAAFDVAAINVANDLKGTLVEATATELGEDADNYVYVLNKVDDNVGFYHLGGEGSKLAANRAYLLVDKDLVNNNATKAFTFTFDEATGISNVNAATKTDGKRFSISGQTVGKGYKGIVIINGKKYVE